MNNASDVKDKNISALLKVVHTNKAISKGNIANELGLTTVTVNKLMAELCESDICTETGDYISYGGRKAALYRINSQYAVMFGVVVMRSRINFTVYDFGFNKIEQEEVSQPLQEINQVLQTITEKLSLLKQKYSDKKIIGAGICIPGRASKEGVIFDMPEFPQWNSLDLRARISDACGIDIIVDNDANAMALAAKWYGFIGNTDNFVYLKIDEGLGAGIMLEDKILGGSTNCGAELGHITINVNGLPCKCGRKGCAQAYLSETAVIDRVNASLGTKTDIKQVVELYKAGNKQVKEIVSDFMEYLKIMLDNVSLIFDTEGVILQNYIVENLPEIAVTLKGSVFEDSEGRITRSFRHRPPVYVMNNPELKDAAAVSLVYEKFMDYQG